MRRLGLVALVLLFLFSSGDSHACSCSQISHSEAYDRSDVVFSGVIIHRDDPNAGAAIRSSTDPLYLTFDVSRIWKGASADMIVLRTNLDSASCGYPFRDEGHYLVFARLHNGDLTTSLCTRTTPLESAHADLCQLPDPVWANPAHDVIQPSLDDYIDSLERRISEGINPPLHDELLCLTYGRERLLPVLVEQLEDDEEGYVIGLLGSYGYAARPYIPRLLDQLLDERKDVRVWTVWALCNICPEATAIVSGLRARSSSSDCAVAYRQLKDIRFGPEPPESVADRGGRVGPLWMLERRRP